MPAATGPASVRSLEKLHRTMAKVLNDELTRLNKANEPIPAALLQAAASMLKLTGVTQPKQPARKADRLSATLVALKDHADDEPFDGSIDFDTRLPDGRVE